MPLYTFCLKSNSAVEKDFFFPMEKAPRIGEMVKIEGKKWIRIISENVSGLVKGSDNPCSAGQFLDKTARQKGNIGNVLDEAREQSEKRKKQFGHDPIQRKWFDNYSKKRHGKKHPMDK